jgi:hypothetical protein
MVHIGMNLHHRNSYVAAITDDGELIPGRRVYHDRIDDLWQYLSQFGDDDCCGPTRRSSRWR